MEAKLRRFSGMRLSRMQDLGGCRAILSDVGSVDRLVRIYADRRQSHDLVRSDDYIAEPKADGYRGVHLVYRYRSRSDAGAVWNGLRIEVQMRSRLQHAWAAAVETVDAIRGTRLKTGGPGNGRWDRFFALMGSVLAIRERRPAVPGTPTALAELRDEATTLERELGVMSTLLTLGVAVHRVDRVAGLIRDFRRVAAWYLLTVDSRTATTSVRGYGATAFEDARAEYLRREEQHRDSPGIQVCLVSTTSAEALRRAYPNYHLNSQDFLGAVAELYERGSRRVGP